MLLNLRMNNSDFANREPYVDKEQEEVGPQLIFLKKKLNILF